MESHETIARIVLAGTLLSLDSAYRVGGRWSVSPVILQIWLEDHLQVVSPPCEMELYRARPILVRHESERDWSSWLLGLTPDEFLWCCPWYSIRGFMTIHVGYCHAYLLEIFWLLGFGGGWVAYRVFPPDGAVFASGVSGPIMVGHRLFILLL